MNLNTKIEATKMDAIMSELQSTCFNLCVKDLSTSELNTQEVNCVDKCAWKYASAHNLFCSVIINSTQEGAKRVTGGAGSLASTKI